jgi:hypothetical protein
LENLVEVATAATIRRPHAVRICALPGLIGDVRFRRHEEGTNRRVVTRSVKVLEVQGVVPRLVVIGEPELAFSAPELDRKDTRSRNQNGVDSAAEPGNIELKVERARQSLQRPSQNLNFFFPRLPLIDLEVVGV